MAKSKKRKSKKIDVEATVVTDSFNADAGPVDVLWRDGEVEHTGSFTESFIIGRDPDCDITVADTSVSRKHARVSPVGGHATFYRLAQQT